MRNILTILLVIFMLQGCDSIDDMKGMFDKQALAQELIKSKYGWESQIGFNINNGVLTQVTLILNAEEVGKETVENLDKITKEVVAKVFKSKPRAIYIQIVSQLDSK